MFLFLILVILFIFLINLSNQDNKIYYVNIDSTNSLTYNKKIYNEYKKNNKLKKYINYFSKKDYRTTDLIKDIEENKKINNQTIQNALIKSDILTLYIGINDINYKLNNKEELYDYTDQVIDDIERLIKLIREYSKEKIYVIGFKNNKNSSYNDYFKYTNDKLKIICSEYKVIYININNNKINNKNVINKIFTKKKQNDIINKR